MRTVQVYPGCEGKHAPGLPPHANVSEDPMTPRFLTSELPLIAAPMAGGATTVQFAAAAATAGAFPFLAGGYKTAEGMGAEIAELRADRAAFGVNLFVPDRADPGSADGDAAAFAAYARELADEAATYGITLDPIPRDDDDGWPAKLALLCADPVEVVSLTFGLPAAGDIALLRRAGSAVLATVTTAGEARAADEAGVDGLIVQGPRAGGHSATWDPRREVGDAATSETLAAVRSVTRLPLVAAGGVDGPRSVRTLLDGGAAAVAVGTLLLCTDEAGTSATHRAALASDAFVGTAITRVFTGRPARGLRNGFIDRHAPHEITAYPAVHHLTRELRTAAGAAGDADRLHLWAGTGYRSAKAEPVARTLERLANGL